MARRGRKRKPIGYVALRAGRPVAVLVKQIRRRKRNIGIDREFERAVASMPADFARQLDRELAARGRR